METIARRAYASIRRGFLGTRVLVHSSQRVQTIISVVALAADQEGTPQEWHACRDADVQRRLERPERLYLTSTLPLINFVRARE